MNELFIITSSLFFLWIIREIFFWLTIWQQSEYRQDRFLATIRKKIKKFKLINTLFYLSKWILFFCYFFVLFNDSLLLPYQYGIIVLYFLQSFFLIKEIYRNQLKKPTLTIRATLIIFLTIATILAFFAIPLVDRFYWLLFIDLLTPTIVTFFVLIFLFPVEIYTDWQIEKAGQKVRKNPNLIVIAVTGSSGKSLVKDYIAKLLGRKFSVIKTEGKNNTMIGVSQTILKKLDDDTEIFVAEISAYQQGEIGLLCELIQPKFGVLTAINNHYLSLFRSLEIIKKTNYELVESLPKNGMCLFYGNNKNTISLYKKSKKKKILYQSLSAPTNEIFARNEITAIDIHRTAKNINFTVYLKGKPVRLRVNTSYNVDLLLPAIFLASHLGMTETEIRREIAFWK